MISPSSRDPRAIRSRKALAAAFVALLDERPFAAITAADIAARAGIGYATFFRHYADPAALLADMADGMVAELLERLAAHGEAGGAMRIVAAYVADHRLPCHALLVAAGAETQRRIAALAVARSAALPRPLDSDLPVDLALPAMVATAFAILTWWLDRAPGTGIDEIATLLDRLAVRPFAVPDQPSGRDHTQASTASPTAPGT